MSKAVKVAFRRKTLMSRSPESVKSRFPISTKRPKSAQALQLSWSRSPVKLLSTMSTPRPFVAFNIFSKNEESRELNMWSGSRSNVATRKSFFACVLTVVKIFTQA